MTAIEEPDWFATELDEAAQTLAIEAPPYIAEPPKTNGHQPPPPPNWPKLDRAALYGLAGEVVAILEPHTEADPVALLGDFLVSFGSAVGAGPHALADAAPHPARLNIALVGDTAKARKGSSRSQIVRLTERVDSRWARSRVMGGLASGEGLIAAVRDPDDDGNGGVVDKRLMVVEEEFARVLTAAGRDTSTLSAIVRQAWDRGDLRVMTRKDPLVATGAHISVLAHITREELTRRLSEVEIANGFANRFLFLAVRRSKRLPTGGNLSDDTLEDLSRLVRSALDQARRRGRLVRSEAAEERWAELYDLMAEDEADGIQGALAARAEAQTLRLSVAYALTDGAGEINVDHLEAAWALWQYARASVDLLFSGASGNSDVDRMVAALEDAGSTGLSRKQQHAVYSNHLEARHLEAVVRTLIEQELAVESTRPTGGRPERILVGARHAK